ncbi:MAG: response regulator [Elusimicrobiales bacterium]|nr:response regulator [Elusimicrobiales bacterium]
MAAQKRMLIIDDNSMIQSLFRADFEDEYEVRTAENGANGLLAASDFQPDVILLDINLPDISGVDVARRLFLDPATRAIPVLVITASEYNAETQGKLRPYGNFKGFLSKVTPSETIRETIKGILG